MKISKIAKYTLFFIIILLIGARLALPYYLLHYVERQINKIPEYRVKIADLDVHLYRGSYTLKDIQLWKITRKIPVPYFKAKTIDFSIEWKALFHGKLVAKIITNDPVIQLVTDRGKNQQITISSQWLDIVKTLFPLNINRFDAHHGEIYFRSFKGSPPFNAYIKSIEFTIKNMQNAERKNELLSSLFEFTGIPMNQGTVIIKGKFDPFNKKPTFDIDAKLISLNVASIAPLLKHYTKIDVESGTFSLYGEIAAAKGRITGYAKPFLKNLKIGSPKDGSPVSAIVDGLAAIGKVILENSEQKTVATKIKLSGTIDSPDTSILSVIGYMIQHAFINALLPEIDNTVGLSDVYYGKQPHRRKNNKRPPFYRP